MSNLNNVSRLNQQAFTKACKKVEGFKDNCSRTMFVASDVHYPEDYDKPIIGNTDITNARHNIQRAFQRQGIDCHVMWSREIHDSIHPHYHLLTMLYSRQFKSGFKPQTIIQEQWQKTIGSNVNGLRECCPPPGEKDIYKGIRVDQKDPIPEDVYARISYMTKDRDKGPVGDGLRNYGL